MSLAVFTDSTTAHGSPALTLRPAAGSSTNTTSVSSCWAWSVMPTVAVPPATRTHSCDLAYFKSEGTFALICCLFRGGRIKGILRIKSFLFRVSALCERSVFAPPALRISCLAPRFQSPCRVWQTPAAHTPAQCQPEETDSVCRSPPHPASKG